MSISVDSLDAAIRGVEFHSVLLSAKIETLVIQQYIIELAHRALVECREGTQKGDGDVKCVAFDIWLDERPFSPLARALSEVFEEDASTWNDSIKSELQVTPGVQMVEASVHQVPFTRENGLVVPRLQLSITITF